MKNKFKLLSILILTGMILPGSNACGQEFRKAGTAGFVFLEIPVSARSQAMAETGITMSDMYSEGLYVNPALIALSQNRISLNATYSKWYVDTKHMAAGITYKIPVIGTIGFSIVSFDFGTMKKTRVILQDRGEEGKYFDLGSFSAQAYTAGLTYARALTERFSMGISAKYVRETIDQYYADNFVFDLGFLYLTGFETLRIGAFLQSFGLETAYANEKFRMPQILKMGLSYDFFGTIGDRERLTLLAEALHPSDAGERVHLGMEAVLLGSVIIRAGYKFAYDDEDLTIGLGLKFNYHMNSFRADFSFQRHAYLEDTFRYSLVVDL